MKVFDAFCLRLAPAATMQACIDRLREFDFPFPDILRNHQLLLWAKPHKLGGWKMGAIIGWIIFGAIAGAIAKLLMPGRDPGGFIVTTLLGIAGAVVGGFIGHALWGSTGV